MILPFDITVHPVNGSRLYVEKEDGLSPIAFNSRFVWHPKN